MPDLPSGERRKNKRVSFIQEVDVVGSGTQRCSDLNVEGMYLETVCSFPDGTFLDLQFSLSGTEERLIKVQARVIYQHPGVGVGLEFVDLSPDDREGLVKFIDQR